MLETEGFRGEGRVGWGQAFCGEERGISNPTLLRGELSLPSPATAIPLPSLSPLSERFFHKSA